MKTEKLDKCLNFAAGLKDFQVSYTAKSPDFPENLLKGNQNEQIIKKYREQGVTYQKILELTNKTSYAFIGYASQSIKKKEMLYWDWLEFWREIEPVRSVTLAELCQGDKVLKNRIPNFEAGGVVTVGDFLLACVRCKNLVELSRKLNCPKSTLADVRGSLFALIREKIILTVRIEDN